jgi:hypothetical protein
VSAGMVITDGNLTFFATRMVLMSLRSALLVFLLISRRCCMDFTSGI